MTKFKSMLMILIVVLPTLVWPTALHAEPVGPDTTDCLYPSPTDRFGITADGDKPIGLYDVSPLAAGRYLDWRASLNPLQPSGMRYYQMVRVTENGYYIASTPRDATFSQIVLANPGATWIIGNEADLIWQDNVTPEAYARQFHNAYTAIHAIDPTARFVSTGLAQVSRLRLAWLERVWNTYRTLYGTDLPVDMWNIHTYVFREMNQEWGFQLPTGIPNAVGYSDYYGTQWSMASDAGASGGTIYQSRTTFANAWFGFRGNEVTLYLRTGPDSGIASIYLDDDVNPTTDVDLYAATPGTVTRHYTDLPLDPGLIGDRHSIRIQVTGRKNAASSSTWVRVDAISAPSTVTLPGARFEDNDPLRAWITNVADLDNLDIVVQQIRDFRQWMAEHDQRDKPLINTEFGLLAGENLGYDYLRARTYMLGSFNRFLNELVDPNLGYPQDGNRLLQEWFWFTLSITKFENAINHTGLYDHLTYAIKPLGIDFANFVAPLKQNYRDLDAYSLALTPYWPLFAGDPSVVNVKTVVRNLGNVSTGSFQVAVKLGTGTLITSWTVPDLAKRFEPGHRQESSYNWQTMVTGNQTVRLIVDEPDQIVEPCANSNNARSAQLVVPGSTDLALSNPTTVPVLLPPIQPGATTMVTLKADLANLGSVGTSAAQIAVKFWNGDPETGGTLIGSQVLTRGNVSLPATPSVTWPNRSPGIYDVYVTVDPVPEETNLQNNRQHFRFTVPVSVAYLPLTIKRTRTLEEVPAAVSGPDKNTSTLWLP